MLLKPCVPLPCTDKMCNDTNFDSVLNNMLEVHQI